MIDVARVAVIGADLVSLRALLGAAPSFYHRNQWSVIWLLTRLSSFPHVRVCVFVCMYASPENIHCGCLSTS